MVDDTPKDGGPASETGAEGGRRPRTPPTIDLEASRVETAAAQASDAAADEGAEPRRADTSAEAEGATYRPRRAGGLLAATAAGAIGALVIGGAGWVTGLIGNSNALSM